MSLRESVPVHVILRALTKRLVQFFRIMVIFQVCQIKLSALLVPCVGNCFQDEEPLVRGSKPANEALLKI